MEHKNHEDHGQDFDANIQVRDPILHALIITNREFLNVHEV